LMMPIGRKISAENLFVKDKYVSEELRNLAMETNTLFVTASQLNRGAVEEIEFDHSHISGGLSKIQTADNVIGIFTSRAMRERGRYQIQLMKTRNSSGVNAKIDLDFNIDTLRITDSEDEEGVTISSTKSADSILNKVKRDAAAPKSPDEVPESAKMKITAKTDSTKLRDFLNNLKTSEED